MIDNVELLIVYKCSKCSKLTSKKILISQARNNFSCYHCDNILVEKNRLHTCKVDGFETIVSVEEKVGRWLNIS